jgi:pentatricopeptide repeat protein
MISSEESTLLQPHHNGGVPSFPVEHEMGTHQRGLIDTCLEEGQFDSAIALLDQLRSSICKPHVCVNVHLRSEPIDISSPRSGPIFAN